MTEYAESIHPKTRKKIEHLLDHAEKLSSARYVENQYSVFYEEKTRSLAIIHSHIDIPARRVDRIMACDWIKLSHEPFRLDQDELTEEQIDFLQQFLGDCYSQKYPTPEQLRNMGMYLQMPSSPMTQSLFKVCKDYFCLCPLALSPIGCFFSIKQDVELGEDADPELLLPTYEDERHRWKLYRNCIHALRQQIEYSDLVPELQKHISVDDFKLG